MLKKLGITKEDLTSFEFGDDIPEAQERRLIDQIGEPVLLTHFPAGMKAFYMLRTDGDPRLTDSVIPFFHCLLLSSTAGSNFFLFIEFVK